MKIITWNISDVSRGDLRTQLRDLLKTNNPDITYLMDIK